MGGSVFVASHRPTAIDCLVLTTESLPANAGSLPTTINCATVTLASVTVAPESLPAGIDCSVLTIESRSVDVDGLPMRLKWRKRPYFREKPQSGLVSSPHGIAAKAF